MITTIRCPRIIRSNPDRTLVNIPLLLPWIFFFGTLKVARRAGMSTRERIIAARTPNPVNTPNWRCGMRNEFSSDRNPATVVNPAIETGETICKPVSITAVRLSTPAATSS